MTDTPVRGQPTKSSNNEVIVEIIEFNNNIGEHTGATGSKISWFDIAVSAISVVAHPCTFLAMVWRLVDDVTSDEILYEFVTPLIYLISGLIGWRMSLHMDRSGPIPSSIRQANEASDSEVIRKSFHKMRSDT